MSYMMEMGLNAKAAAERLKLMETGKKNEGLLRAADALEENGDVIFEANRLDVRAAREKGAGDSMVDRLCLNGERIRQMAEGLRQIAALPDPVGEMDGMITRPNGLRIGERRVPLGVVGIIYESRPNVTADAFGLCFKTGNAVILKGGSDAVNSNRAITGVLRKALKSGGADENALQLVEKTDRETAKEMMRLHGLIDVLIPRGGAGLIKTVVENSTVPVIETGTGNCHIYVDESADPDMAKDIVVNAKTQRMGVCNACESLVVHADEAEVFIPMVVEALKKRGVEIRGDKRAGTISGYIVPACDEDWGREYLDAVISLKTVDCFEDAVRHINRYNTGHSEAIITKDYERALRFQDEIDAAAVYVNASTRFTDGYEFGFGAEIGISTQKLHARGPMGLKALTTKKYIIFGTGQVRA